MSLNLGIEQYPTDHLAEIWDLWGYNYARREWCERAINDDLPLWLLDLARWATAEGVTRINVKRDRHAYRLHRRSVREDEGII